MSNLRKILTLTAGERRGFIVLIAIIAVVIILVVSTSRHDEPASAIIPDSATAIAKSPNKQVNDTTAIRKRRKKKIHKTSKPQQAPIKRDPLSQPLPPINQ